MDGQAVKHVSSRQGLICLETRLGDGVVRLSGGRREGVQPMLAHVLQHCRMQHRLQ